MTNAFLQGSRGPDGKDDRIARWGPYWGPLFVNPNVVMHVHGYPQQRSRMELWFSSLNLTGTGKRGFQPRKP